jgi:hypothetical protein
MQTSANFSVWGSDINNTGVPGAVWRIYEGRTDPLLINFMGSMTLSDVFVTYNGTAQTFQVISDPGLLGNAATGTNAGTYTGYHSYQLGYNIIGGNLIINPLEITLVGSRTYDGSSNVMANILTPQGLIEGESLSVSGLGILSDGKNVGENKAVNISSLALGDCISIGCVGLGSNYSIGSVTVTVTQKTITQSGLSVASSKVYDGSRSATVLGSAGLTSEAVGSGTSSDGKAYDTDTVGLVGSAVGTYNSKNVADASSVAFSGLSLIGADAENYVLQMQADMPASITKADAVVIANSGRRYYNGSTQSLTGFTVNGLVNQESPSVLTSVAAFGTGIEVGEYPVIVSGTDANYDLTFVDGVLTIQKPTTNAALSSVVAMFGSIGKSDKPQPTLANVIDVVSSTPLIADNIKLPDNILTALPVGVKK